MLHWMFNCREVSRMASEALDRKLPLHERIGGIGWAVEIRSERRQLLLLRDMIRLYALHEEETVSSVSLSPEARKRMKEALNNRTR